FNNRRKRNLKFWQPATICQERSEVAVARAPQWLSCREKDWATAASEPRCRCVSLHHRLDRLRSAEYKDVARMIPLTISRRQSKRAPPRIVSSCLGFRPLRLITHICLGMVGPPLPKAEIVETLGPSATSGMRTQSLSRERTGLPGKAMNRYLAHHNAEAPKERGACGAFCS